MAGDADGSLAGVEFLAEAGDGWRSLIQADWQLPAGAEAHLCARMTVARDAFLHEFKPVIPLGTHHTVLTVREAGHNPDGVVSCGADVSGRQVFGSGVGTESMSLPDGIAARVSAGQQLQLNLHLFNVGGEPLEGRSGVLVRTMDAAEVEHEAEGVLAGPLSLTIPPGRVMQSGQCTFDADATIISVGAHMHQLGVHMKVTAHSSERGPVVLFDGPYEFESQQRHPVEFVPMRAGDVVSVECSYENDTGATVSWGQSSLDEMCFAGLTRYPARDSTFVCTN